MGTHTRYKCATPARLFVQTGPPSLYMLVNVQLSNITIDTVDTLICDYEIVKNS